MQKRLLAGILSSSLFVIAITAASLAFADGRAEMSRGLQALKLKSYRVAIVHLSAAIEAADLEPRTLSDAHYFRSRALIRSRERALAISDLSLAIRYWPENIKALRVRCRALTLDAKLSKAEADCDEAVRLAPEDWRGWFTRGLLRREQNQPDEAKEDFTAARRHMPAGLETYPLVARQFREFGVTGDVGKTEPTVEIDDYPTGPIDEKPAAGDNLIVDDGEFEGGS